MDAEIIRAAQRYTQVSSHLSQAPSTKEVVRLLDNADEDDLIKFLDTRVEKEGEVAEYVRAVFIGMIHTQSNVFPTTIIILSALYRLSY